MSPPSLATAGRTRVSIRSLMVATVSASAGSKNSPDSSAAALAPDATIGAPDMKCSMIAPRIAGLSCGHSPSALVTVMKSEPRNTPPTPWMSNSRSASGDCAASALLGMSSVPLASTVRPGRNLSVAGLGVASVWMNIVFLHERRRLSLRRPISKSLHKWAFAAPRSMRRRSTGSGQRVEVLVAQIPRNDRDRDRIISGVLADARDERTGTLLAGSRGQHQRRDVLVLVDEFQDFGRLLAVAHDALGRNAGDAVGARRELIEDRVRGQIGR